MSEFVFIDRSACEKLISSYYEKEGINAVRPFWKELFALAVKEKKTTVAQLEEGIFIILHPPMKPELRVRSVEASVKLVLEKIFEFGDERIVYSLSETEKYLDLIDSPYWEWMPEEYGRLLKEGEFGSNIFVSSRWLYIYLSNVISDLKKVTDLSIAVETSVDKFLQGGIFQVKCGKSAGQMNMPRLLAKMVFGGFTKEYFYRIMLDHVRTVEILDKKGKLDPVTTIKREKIPRKY